jgi:hypothetical protein
MPSKPQSDGQQTGKLRIFLRRHMVIEGAVISGCKPKQALLDDDQTVVEVNMSATHMHPVYDNDQARERYQRNNKDGASHGESAR